jgi:enterochelin esterase-like enzyme
VLADSSEPEPAPAKERQKTIDASFPGDAAPIEVQTPLSIMDRSRFDSSGVYLAAGERDPEFIGYMNTLAEAARKSGFSVSSKPVEQAGHSWDTPSKGMADGLAFLAGRWGLNP